MRFWSELVYFLIFHMKNMYRFTAISDQYFFPQDYYSVLFPCTSGDDLHPWLHNLFTKMNFSKTALFEKSFL